MRPSISKSDIEEAHRVHKKLLTTFEIAAPTVLPKDISNNVIFRMDLGKLFIRVSKHKKDELKNVQKFYEAMKSNYEIEFGDLIKFSDPSLVYLIMCTTIEKGLTSTLNFKYVGVIEVNERIIQFLWLHPFLRNKGLMTHFFKWYANNEEMLCVQPPISEPMFKVMKKV